MIGDTSSCGTGITAVVGLGGIGVAVGGIAVAVGVGSLEHAEVIRVMVAMMKVNWRKILVCISPPNIESANYLALPAITRHKAYK
jgi:hypothetical protein